MKPAWIVVVVVAALAVVLRVVRTRRQHRRGLRSAVASLGRRLLRSEALGDTGLVAAREIRERLRGRFFKVITLIILAVVAAAIVIPTLDKGSAGPVRIGVVGSLSASTRQGVQATARSVGVIEQLVPEASPAEARTGLASGRIDLAIIDGQSLLVNRPVDPSDTSSSAQLVRSLARVLGIGLAFQSAGLSASQAVAVTQAKPLPVHSLQPATNKHRADRGTSVISLVLIFVMLTQYNTWTLMGVMEEKSSRVVEVLLATVRPLQLLAGKLLGIGVVALAQAGLIVAFALILAQAVGSSLLHGAAPLVLVSTFVWLVLGYAFYSWVYAAAGSLAERQDQVQSLALPLSVPLIFSYVVTITAVSSGHGSALIQVLAYLPPTAPFAMPVLVGLSDTTWWGFLISALLSVAGTVVVARAAANIYRRAVLRTGRRVRVREVLAPPRGPADRAPSSLPG